MLLVCVAATARAQTGAFVTRLGSDTIAVERFTRTRDSIVGEMIVRSPKTRRIRYVARLAPNGSVATYTARWYESGAPNAPLRTRVDADLRGDSVHVTIKQGDSTRTSVVPLAHPIPLLEPAYGLHELLVRRAFAAGGKPAHFSWWFVGDGPDTGSVEQAGAFKVRIMTPTDTIRIDASPDGEITQAVDPGGTLQATVSRIPSPDLDKVAMEFAQRESQGRGLGVLSPRDTVRATVGDAKVLVDYGRPSRRGRTIFGNVVPYNTVWRTGANAATTLVVDHDIMLGSTKLPAGEYTLFSVSTPSAWTLIVSKKTKEWGTDYDSTADFARIPLETDTAEDPVEQFTISIDAKGALAFAWDTRVGRVAMRAADN